MSKSQGMFHQEYYQIKVEGRLGSQWSDWFEGMTVTSEGGDTTLIGWFAD